MGGRLERRREGKKLLFRSRADVAHLERQELRVVVDAGDLERVVGEGRRCSPIRRSGCASLRQP
jgi:hypothetical protein